LAYGFEIFSRDVKQASVQADPLERKLAIKPPQELQRPPGEYWIVVRPLDGTDDAPLLWFSTFTRSLKSSLCAESAATDPCLLYSRVEKELRGLLATHVDDTIFCVTPDVLKNESSITKRFECREVNSTPLTFAGVTVSRLACGGALLDQEGYATKLGVQMPLTAEAFRTIRGQLLTILVHTCALKSLASPKLA